MIGRQVKLRTEGVRLLKDRLDEAANWNATKLSSLQVAVDRAAAAVSSLRVVPKDHAWFGTNIDAQSPFDMERLLPYLNMAIETIAALEEETTKIIAAVSSKTPPSIADSIATVRAFRHVAAVPKQFRSILANSAWARDLAALETAIEQGQKLASSIGEVEERFVKEAWGCNTEALLLVLNRDGGSLFRRIGRRYRKANAELRALCRNKPPKELRNRIALVEMLRRGQECRQQFAEKARLLKPALGSMWADYRTEWADTWEIAVWVRRAMVELGGAKLLTFAARAQDLRVYSSLADKFEVMAKAAAVAFDDVQRLVRASLPAVFESQNCANIPMRQLSNRIAAWRDNLETVNDWVAARNAIIHLRSEGLGIIADGLVNRTIPPNEARSITELLIAESLWRRAATEDPELSTLDGNARTECVLEFRDFDQQRIRAARHEVVARYLDQRPNGYAGAMGVIRGEINKKRGHRPIRKLMVDAGSAIQQLKPIFLMSPLSVAQFLPPGRLNFSILMIDEASQVAPEDALGVVARANQIVVVGDDKQLPPTNFFKIVNAGDEYAEDDSEKTLQPDRPTDFESILTLARARGMSERMLAWHYRSKHPSLIALSNEECYAGRLLLPPSPFVQSAEFGLSLVRTPRGHYDRGGTRCDLVQAEHVAKAIADHILLCPSKSLGVACLSVQQRDAVDDMIDKIGLRAEVEAFLPKDERLFVKNLEAVQGDERDVIFISVGYGVAPNHSKPFLNFGPVSQEGGERRLNVLASRAREKCVVFSSITSADIPADSESRGTRMLRGLLNFAETGKLGAGTFQGDEFESPFEEAVARKILEAGFHVHPQVGVKSFRIDLGVIDPPRPGEYILGVECDGAAYHSARSARDRDRLRQEVLEGLGWRLHRIWSTEWFRNPQREFDKLLAAIREAKNKAVTPKTELVSDDDIPELDEKETTAEAELDDVNDEADIPSNTVVYKECVLTVPFRRDLLDIPVAEFSRFTLEVVGAEGPIHTYEVARRIREAFGLQKTGKRILAHVTLSLQHLSRKANVTRDGEFWSLVGRNVTAARNRRNAALSLRRATMIAPAEYQVALLTIIADAVAISADDLVVETARFFGFDRTGADLKEAIDRQVERLVKERRLHLDENGLRLLA